MSRAVRVILALQALCLIGFLATVFPSFLERITSPPVDCPLETGCFDPTGAAFVIYTLILVPVGGALLAVAWLWRDDSRRWPAIVPVAIDLLLIGGAISNLNSPSDPVNNPPVAADVLLLLVPAIVSLAAVVTFVVLTTRRRNRGDAIDAPRAQNSLT